MARLLLDEQLPVRLAAALSSHEVQTVRSLQWTGLSDSSLLARAAGQFEVFVTMDKAVAWQQSIEGRSFGVLLIRAWNNSFLELGQHIERISAAAANVPAGLVLVLDLRSSS